MKKYLIIAAVIAAAIAANASAATSNVCPSYPGEPCAGGPTRGWNYTTNQFEMVPQCFPWVWLNDYFRGNIVAMYQNQELCKAQRLKDFR